MDPWIDWLRARPYHTEQIVAHRTEDATKPVHRSIELPARLGSALADRDIVRPYLHQAEAIEAVRGGKNVVLATPTASGKSLAYTIPAFERAMASNECTLYIGPQNALIADQEASMCSLADELGFGSRVIVRQYTGRMSQSEKRAVRERRPTVLLTTPDMLHYGILAHAQRLWEWYFRNLSLIVVDECHVYRGVFGSQVAMLLRRLTRLCARFDTRPQVICCSATIGNPREHAARLCGRSADSFEVLTEDTSATGPREWVFWKPPTHDDDGPHGRRTSHHVASMRLFTDLVRAGKQVVVFSDSRQVAERYAMQSQQRLQQGTDRDLARRVHAYEAALGHERRLAIEEGLNAGEIRGVWSTSALELGIDIGGLDAVILDGYPGTRTDTHQRAGRAGRGNDRSLVVLVGGEDQLDQYVMGHPQALFETAPERAVVNPSNPELLPGHLRAAARESWLRPNDERYFGSEFPEHVSRLDRAGLLERRAVKTGIRWTDGGSDSPHHAMSIRTIDDERISLMCRDSGDTLASLSRADAMRDAHRGAIYHHQGQRYEVVELDLDNRRAELSSTWADVYTNVRHEKTLTVRSRDRERTLQCAPDASIGHGECTVRTQITGFVRRDVRSGQVIAEEPLDLPETTIHTEGVYITVPAALQARLTESGDFPGGIHAAEHGMISLFPLSVLCDRRDIGGLSTPHHPDTGAGTIFIYDGHPGGVGLTSEAYERIEPMLGRTRDLIATCGCAAGCPACVQSPQCGNGNEPLDPDTAIALLNGLLTAPDAHVSHES